MPAYLASRTAVENLNAIRLTDVKRQQEVTVVPAFGHNAFDFHANGKQIFWTPPGTVKDWREQRKQAGNPFMAPWANRIDGNSYVANGKRYQLNRELGNIRGDQNQNPIHGLVMFSDAWEVAAVEANEEQASVTSVLEFWRHPAWMQQFPFAHTVRMTYRLSGGALEVQTSFTNHALEPMPLVIGFHPWFQLSDAPRDEWQVTLPVKEHYVLSPRLIPTGEKKAPPWNGSFALRDVQLDDVFGGLVRDAKGHAVFAVQGKQQRLEVAYGPRYNTAVVYSPKGSGFICFEPMTGITNAANLAAEGKYKELQSVAPGETWKESYWIRPTGF
jgi:aldose 1-epimerase